ncbi:undecaprenyldiphospho-muramoylpentapeptide beta-N-acetylglucosaminyltransferase [Marivibrio halodurans]|uniref:UDP-N-acetylglucosamine--N-acetylmuramyl-(pentapeptide) pyrophosphoryl-undecaprenol N-acetylglucosamine transferase n=1 Tax=Marivibrio halodurans TaxID=2039722 RepID=A0A8J7RZT6_9PROT|nr:undecaprenyldiphospho-muramoylpentapeptide beta-N-acetylglucosaminyltransferase [Marivibrio halodurans]MBP5857732.1 undecaprenyldiphospho-muramoylpentapeptide beta-N-acetylglucosaminyltransferase [Marivibrio halodurans]
MSGNKAIALATGGTGGHVFPAQALAEELGARGYRLMLITDRRGDIYGGPLGALETHTIRAAGVSGQGFGARLGAAVQLGLGYFQARRLLRELAPAAVVGFGGYPSVPTMMAASHLKLRTAIHEQNAILGRANRLLAPRVRRIALSFERTADLREADQKRSLWTGNPVRPEIAAIAAQSYPSIEAGQAIRLLITGGSQGAQILGETVPAAIGSLPEEMRKRLRISQQVRAEQLEFVTDAYRTAGIAADVRAFFDDMPKRLGEAHLLIARAGASTTAELTCVGRPAILIPYPYAVDDHQTANAARLCDDGGAWMIPQKDLTPDALADRLMQLLAKPEVLTAAGAAAARIGMPEATRNLADMVAGLVDDAEKNQGGTGS